MSLYMVCARTGSNNMRYKASGVASMCVFEHMHMEAFGDERRMPSDNPPQMLTRPTGGLGTSTPEVRPSTTLGEGTACGCLADCHCAHRSADHWLGSLVRHATESSAQRRPVSMGPSRRTRDTSSWFGPGGAASSPADTCGDCFCLSHNWSGCENCSARSAEVMGRCEKRDSGLSVPGYSRPPHGLRV